MTRAIIFDLDGTLLDSVDLHAKAWQKALQEFGHTVAYADIRSQIGKGGDQILPLYLSPEEIESRGKDLTERRGRIFKEEYLSQVKPFPGVRQLFEKVRESGQTIAIASSAKGDELKQFEELAGIADLVDVETSSADADRSKPHPDIFHAALERLGSGFSKDQIIVVGDTPHDAEGAAKAGLRTVGVRCGGFAEEDLLRSGCIAVYEGPEELYRRYADTPLFSEWSGDTAAAKLRSTAAK